ncbi:MAG TPA: hypothetical protein PKH58_04865 [Paludibacteraceae bacterium]|nr:hypothetical protein [Paludibacteraceae bacterium]
MIKVSSDSKIYVICPADRETGGTELAHQLVDCLIHKGIDAYIVYVDDEKYVDAEIPVSFGKYLVHVAPEPVDDEKNVVVCPEAIFSFALSLKKIQIIFWWMSVDNFFLDARMFSQLNFFGIYTTLRYVYGRYIRHQPLFGKMTISKLKSVKNRHLHVFQSEYARQFLLSVGINDPMPLSDYIDTDFINNSLTDLHKKENIILYNPRKGFEFTKKIIDQLPDYKFVALQDMNKSELHGFLKKAKLYIDFGNHPGKDRLPREAAVNHCCVITGTKGSAKYIEDVAIPDVYKLEKNELATIKHLIIDVLENYEQHISAFGDYRQKILNEKSVFESEVERIFF